MLDTNAILNQLPIPIQEASTAVVTPDRIWQTWNWDIPIFTAIMFSLWLYNRGLIRLWKRLGFGRGVTYWQAAAFVIAMLTMFIALISPLEVLSHALFSAHMLQHVLLIMLTAPLLVAGSMQTVLLAALPSTWQYHLGTFWRRSQKLHSLCQFMTQPLLTWITGMGIIWLWHVPLLYEAALKNDLVHSSEHILFVLGSMLFWWPLFRPAQQKHATYGVHVFYLFLSTVQGSVLGALLTFSSQPWYNVYARTTQIWHLTQLQDQQLAGVLMWLPGGLVYFAASLFFLVAWLNALERRMKPTHQQSLENSERQ